MAKDQMAVNFPVVCLTLYTYGKEDKTGSNQWFWKDQFVFSLSLSLSFFFFCFLPTPDLYIYNYVKALFPPFWLFYFSGRGLIIEPKIMKEAKIYSLYLDPFLKMGY